MTKLMDVYKCNVCGNMVEVVHSGKGELVCCGEKMQIMDESAKSGAEEKHIPVVKKEGGVLKIQVGEVLHPMEEKHLIEWVEVLGEEGVIFRKYLKPGDEPKVELPLPKGAIIVRAYCNLHGMWSIKA